MNAAQRTESLFSLDDPLHIELASEGTVHTYPKKAVLITEGDEGGSLFLILSGRVKVYTSDDSGKELILAFYGPGDIVGEMTLDGDKRCASVITTEPTRCAVIPHGRFRDRIKHDPDLAMRLINRLIQRSRHVTKAAKDLALANVYSRVASLLTSLAVAAEGGTQVVDERLSQQDIADRVGSSRDMVSKIFKELVKGGYIELRGREIRLNKKLPANW